MKKAPKPNSKREAPLLKFDALKRSKTSLKLEPIIEVMVR